MLRWFSQLCMVRACLLICPSAFLLKLLATNFSPSYRAGGPIQHLVVAVGGHCHACHRKAEKTLVLWLLPTFIYINLIYQEGTGTSLLECYMVIDLSQRGHGIKLVHWNKGPSYLINKHQEVEIILANHTPHVLGLSEANLKMGHDQSLIQHQDYDLHTCVRCILVS